MDKHIAVTVLTGIGMYLGIRWIITSAFDGLRRDMTAEIRTRNQRSDPVPAADRNGSAS